MSLERLFIVLLLFLFDRPLHGRTLSMEAHWASLSFDGGPCNISLIFIWRIRYLILLIPMHTGCRQSLVCLVVSFWWRTNGWLWWGTPPVKENSVWWHSPRFDMLRTFPDILLSLVTTSIHNNGFPWLLSIPAILRSGYSALYPLTALFSSAKFCCSACQCVLPRFYCSMIFHAHTSTIPTKSWHSFFFTGYGVQNSLVRSTSGRRTVKRNAQSTVTKAYLSVISKRLGGIHCYCHYPDWKVLAMIRWLTLIMGNIASITIANIHSLIASRIWKRPRHSPVSLNQICSCWSVIGEL